MLKSRIMLPVLLGVVLAGFVMGIIYLFQLRFSAGDIYPPYSTLRADPLGAKVFYESLQRLPGLSVNRFFQQAAKLDGNRQRTLFIVGASDGALDSMPPDDYHALRNFVHEGGRLIVSLSSIDESESQPEKTTPSRADATNADVRLTMPISFLITNGLALKSEPRSSGDTGEIHPRLAELSGDFPGLPPLISWHSSVYFVPSNSQWRVVYSLNKHPVMIEKSFGAGSLLFSTDSYFASNEALRKERHPELLAWLVGNRHEILFDETHLGVEQQTGVAVLIRQYRLEGAIVALLFLAVLFVWKNSAPLMPPQPDQASDGEQRYVVGKEAGAGLVSLLRRSVAQKEIVLTAFGEWKMACGRDPRIAARLPKIQTIIDEEKARPPGSRRPLETYQAIRQILTERNL